MSIIADHVPAPLEDAHGPTPGELGSRITRLRTARGISINTLATAADVSRGLVSEIERGMGNPSYKTLVSIARALQVPVGTFFTEDDAEKYGLVRPEERRAIWMHDGLVYELLTPSTQGRLAMYLSYVPPGWTNEELPLQHSGEECMYIMEGDVVVHVGDRVYPMGPGDSVTWDSMEPHWCVNPTDRLAVVMHSMTPPSF